MIEVHNIEYRYPGENNPNVLRGVSFVLNPGERVALMGSNGSGKTTLARCLNGLVLPEQGHVAVDGLETRSEAELYEIRRRVGMVFQNPDVQIVATTVEREIAFGPENLGLDHKIMIRRVEDALKRFKLEEYRTVSPHLLSGGERQRLAFAAVWVMQPDYYVLDEPTSLLDPQGRRTVLDFLDSEVRQKGKGMLLVTQFANEAIFCDRVLILDKGRLVRQGSALEVFSETELLKRLGLDVPVTAEMNQILKESGLAHRNPSYLFHLSIDPGSSA